jgi:hypothetical protein
MICGDRVQSSRFKVQGSRFKVQSSKLKALFDQALKRGKTLLMPDSWTRALNLYCYPVDLGGYQRRNEFPGFFEILISGDRNSTIAFENHFRENAPNNIAAYFEVVFWKLFSFPLVRQGSTNRIVDYVRNYDIKPNVLWDAVLQFIENQNIDNLKNIRKKLGIKARVLAITLTFPALACPEKIPMIDRQVARWVNLNSVNHSINTKKTLTNFNNMIIMDNDFNSYLNLIEWCKEIAEVLTSLSKQQWRARDVEMAVFTAQRNNLPLNPLTRNSGT